MKKCDYDECNNLTKNKRFCCVTCGSKFHGALRETWQGVKQCLFCSAEFKIGAGERKRKFCCQSCAAKYNNKLRLAKTGFHTDANKCPCGNPSPGRIYCSKKCRVSFPRQKRIQEWLSGEYVVSSEFGPSVVIREYLFEEAGFKCAADDCCVPGGWGGFHPVTGKTRLTIDHIDGDATNNTRENLRVLCPNCHSMTENYGSLNTKSTRSYRYRKNNK